MPLRIKKTTFVIWIIMLSFIPALVISDTIEDNFEKSCSVKPGGTLVIESNIGEIAVTGSGNSQVNIAVEQRFFASSKAQAERLKENLELSIEQQGNDVMIRAHFEWPKGDFLNLIGGKLRGPRIKFIITVPEKYNLDLKTGDGNIAITKIEGNVNCRTSDGDVIVSHIAGPLTAKTSDGNVTMDHITGSVEARTSDGDITAAHCSEYIKLTTSDGNISVDQIGGSVILSTSDGDIIVGEVNGSVTAKSSDGDIVVSSFKGNIDAKTSDGDIRATMTEQPDQACSLKTSDGTIELRLNENIKVTLNASASDGRVRTDFPVEVSGNLSKNRLNADINGGGPELFLQTSDGDIIITY